MWVEEIGLMCKCCSGLALGLQGLHWGPLLLPLRSGSHGFSSFLASVVRTWLAAGVAPAKSFVHGVIPIGMSQLTPSSGGRDGHNLFLCEGVGVLPSGRLSWLRFRPHFKKVGSSGAAQDSEKGVCSKAAATRLQGAGTDGVVRRCTVICTNILHNHSKPADCAECSWSCLAQRDQVQ